MDEEKKAFVSINANEILYIQQELWSDMTTLKCMANMQTICTTWWWQRHSVGTFFFPAGTKKLVIPEGMLDTNF